MGRRRMNEERWDGRGKGRRKDRVGRKEERCKDGGRKRSERGGATDTYFMISAL